MNLFANMGLDLIAITCICPDKFKIARVIPIYKKGYHSDLGNYRPISLLSIFSKLLEKLMYKRLLKFLEKYSILTSNQFGFRAKHSTIHAILSIINEIQNAIEDGLFSCGIFLDLSKAFDTVNHNILVHKLKYIGVRGIANNWFVSYLSNRKQFVSIGSQNSDYQSINCGVPQGSVLDPLLFLVYINDIGNCSTKLDFHLFADDTNLFFADKNLKNLEITENDELS